MGGFSSTAGRESGRLGTAAERVARPYHPPRRIPNLLALTSSLRAFFNWLRTFFNRSAGMFNESAGIFNWLAAFGELHSQLRDARSQWCERRDFLGLPWGSSFGCWRPSGSLGPTIRPAAFPTSALLPPRSSLLALPSHLFPLTSSLCLPLRPTLIANLTPNLDKKNPKIQKSPSALAHRRGKWYNYAAME